MSGFASAIREIADKIGNVVMNYSSIEVKVKEATNDDPWGPSGTQMRELAKYTYSREGFSHVMGMLWYRILEGDPSNWRPIYKSLVLLSYLLHYGSVDVVNNTRDHCRHLRSLQRYTCFDENNKDEGIHVRNKAREVLNFTEDTERLREERKKAQASRNKFIGISNEDAKFLKRRPCDASSSLQKYDKPLYRIDWSNARRSQGGASHDDLTAQKDEVVENDEVTLKSVKNTGIDLGAAKDYGVNYVSKPLSSQNKNTTTETDNDFGNYVSEPTNTSQKLQGELRADLLVSVEKPFDHSHDLLQATPADLLTPFEPFANFQPSSSRVDSDPFVSLTHRFDQQLPASGNPASASSWQDDGFADFQTAFSQPTTVMALSSNVTTYQSKINEEQNQLTKHPVLPKFTDVLPNENFPADSHTVTNFAPVQILPQTQPSNTKPNTWSDVKGINIDVDGLKRSEFLLKSERSFADIKKTTQQPVQNTTPMNQVPVKNSPGQPQVVNILPQSFMTQPGMTMNSPNRMMMQPGGIPRTTYGYANVNPFTAPPVVVNPQNPMTFQSAYFQPNLPDKI